MSRLSLYFLGTPQIELDDVPIKVDTRKAIALVAYLAVTGEGQSRDGLVGLLWPDYDQTRARTILRRTLYALNKALPGDWLEADKETIGLNPNSEVWADVDQFRKSLSECQKHGHPPAEACPDCVKLLAEAVGLYRGDFLSGFSLQDSVNFDDWQFFQTQNLRSEMAGVLERLVSWHKGQSKLEAAIGYARRWLEIDRASEAAHRHLMELYARAGQRAAALRQYEECVKVLEKELGEVPEEETVKLYEAIKGNRVAVELPSRKSEKARNNLPRQLTSFIGREREIEEVKKLLSNTCLLTLTGSGGCGKTRLALQVASNLVGEYKDGVWLVDLAPLSDPALVPQAVARAIDVSEQPGRFYLDTLLDYLKSRQLLLVLDNCEHLIEACARLSESLLQACPKLRILATSREALSIAGELTYRVPSLSLPDPVGVSLVSALMQYEAVCLFIERALFSQPTFAATDRNAPTVAKICHRLDGIPLSIELAAARAKVLSVEEIASRLDDRFRLLTGGSRTALPRQQTLRATIDWSYNMLSEAERVLFNRLSVFMGGWTLEAAEAICGDTAGADQLPLPPAPVDGGSPPTSGGGGRERAGVRVPSVHPDDVLDLLTHLVDKSLVVVEEQGGKTRYRFLETVRQYARDKLLESGEGADLRERHLNWFLGLVERAEPEFRGPNQREWLDRLEIEHDNLRAALEWSVGSSEGEEGLRLAGALGGFWFARGYWSEGRRWFEEVLSKSSGASPSVRAKALGGAATLTMSQKDVGRGLPLLEESLSLYRETGDKNGTAWALESLGLTMSFSQGDHERAIALCEESLSLYREVGNKGGIGRALHNLGMVAYLQGDYGRAKTLSEESLSLSREVGDKRHIAFALSDLGVVALRQGDYDQATALYKESLDLFREVGEKFGISSSHYSLGLVALRQGDYERARALYKKSLLLSRELGNRMNVALCLGGLARVVVAQGQPERGARLLGAAEALLEAIGDPLPPSERPDCDRGVAAVRAALGEEAFKAAWEEGRKMTMEEAVEYALSTNP